jgi:hypothetical protein
MMTHSTGRLPLIVPAGKTMSGEALAALILASAAGRLVPAVLPPPVPAQQASGPPA